LNICRDPATLANWVVSTIPKLEANRPVCFREVKGKFRRANCGSQLTHRWREGDSNPRSPRKGDRLIGHGQE
jgi:hypothetical protein